MATSQIGKYTLRRRTNEENYEVLEEDLDSDTDVVSESEFVDDFDDSLNEEDETNDPDLPVGTVNDDQSIELDNPQPNIQAKKTANDVPDGWDMDNWKLGNADLDWLPEFEINEGLLIDLPADATELDFLFIFLTDEVLDSIVLETNKYAANYIEREAAAGRLPPKSRFRLWPEYGITRDRLKVFLALTFYFGIIKKDNVKSYWSTDCIFDTPFPRTVMKRDEFFNIFSFLHLCDNATYIPKGGDGYDPKKKLGFFYESVIKRFPDVWCPRQNLSIDEGCIPFKGRIHFRCYNPSKIDKYHIKTFKLVDSSNNYCVNFDLYTGIDEAVTKFGRTHDLVTRLSGPYHNKSYIIFMDNFYTSPYLLCELKKKQTGAVGTLRLNRKGTPAPLHLAKLKQKGDQMVMAYNNEMVMVKVFDRKVVTLVSTVYNGSKVDTGKIDRKTNKPIKKPLLMTKYNQFMGGVDANDQLLKYSHFSKRTIKWWKKVFFRLSNICMVNAFILWKEFSASKGKPFKKTQTDYRISVISQLVTGVAINCDAVPLLNRSFTDDYIRLTGRHFPQLINVPEHSKTGKVFRTCKVCTVAGREFVRRSGLPKRKRNGHDTRYECKTCGTALCVDKCFELYHTQKHYAEKYMDMFLI